MTNPTLTAQRRQEEKEQRRRSILEAAEQAIATKGFDALTMGDVAKQARLSRGLVYFYFKDKVDLLNALAHEALTELTARFQKAVDAHERGLDQIRAVGGTYVRFAHERPIYFEALARFETRELDPEEAEHHEAATMHTGRRAHGLMVEVIQRGQADGSIRPSLDPLKTAITLWGFTHGMIQVGAMKEAVWEQQYGFTMDELIHHAFEMANLALAAA